VAASLFFRGETRISAVRGALAAAPERARVDVDGELHRAQVLDDGRARLAVFVVAPEAQEVADEPAVVRVHQRVVEDVHRAGDGAVRADDHGLAHSERSEAVEELAANLAAHAIMDEHRDAVQERDSPSLRLRPVCRTIRAPLGVDRLDGRRNFLGG
jgi:hypothetical protein